MALTLSTRPDPFAEFETLIRRAFPARNSGSAAATTVTDFRPAAEVVRDHDDALVKLELPGLDFEKDISVELDGSTLTVSGERRDEHVEQSSEEGSTRFVKEIRYGSFKRSFTLPEHIDADAVSATYDAGVLTIRVAGVYAGTEPKKIAVTGK